MVQGLLAAHLLLGSLGVVQDGLDSTEFMLPRHRLPV